MNKNIHRYFFSSLACTAVFLGASYQAEAAIFSVMNTQNSGPGSFPQVLESVNALVGPHEIVFNYSCKDPHYETEFVLIRRDITLNTVNGVTFSLNKKLSGTTSITKTGSGNLTLEAANSFKGDLKVLAGELYLTNSNNYSGTTSLGKATLGVGHHKSLGNQVVFLQEGSKLLALQSVSLANPIQLKDGKAVFDTNEQKLSLTGTIAGPGGFVKQGRGILALEGLNTYQGAAIVAQGTLAISSADSLGDVYATLEIADASLQALADLSLAKEKSILLNSKNSTIDTQEHTVHILSKLSGVGGLEKIGVGNLFLEADTAFQQSLIVRNGSLSLNGSAGDVQIEGPGSFTGNARVKKLENAGKLVVKEPLHVQSISQAASGSLEIRIHNELKNGPVAVQERAALDGRLVVQPVSGHYPEQSSYPLMQAEGEISGTFKEVAAPAQFQGEVKYRSKDVRYELKKFISLKEILEEPEGDNAASAEALDLILAPPGSDMDNVIASLLALKDDVSLFTEKLSELQPAHFAALGLAQQSNIILVRASIFNRMQDLLSTPCASEWLSKKSNNIWMEAVGDFSKQDNIQSDKGYLANTAAAVTGIDHGFGNFQFGFSAAFSHSHVNWLSGVGKGRINSFYGSLYGLYRQSFWYVEGAVIGGYNHYNAYRNMSIASRTASHENNGYNLSGELGFGFLLKAHKFQFQPFAIFDIMHIFQNSFTETGAGSLNLDVGNKKFGMFRSEIGLNINRCWQFSSSVLATDLKLSYINELQLDQPNFTVNYVGSSTQYTVVGMKPNRNLFSPGFGIRSMLFDNALTVALYYNAEIGSSFVDQRVSAHLGYSW